MTAHKAQVKSQVFSCLKGAEEVTILGLGTVSFPIVQYLCR